MLAPRRITAPSALFTVAELKIHLRVDTTDEDSYIEGLLAAAVAHLDGWGGRLGRCILQQTWQQDFSGFGTSRYFRLPMTPITSVASVKYLDADNVEQTFAPANYGLFEDALGHYVKLVSGASWPSTYCADDAVRVQFVAGAAAKTDDDIQGIRHAVFLMVADWFENREASVKGSQISDLPIGVEALLAPYHFRSTR